MSIIDDARQAVGGVKSTIDETVGGVKSIIDDARQTVGGVQSTIETATSILGFGPDPSSSLLGNKASAAGKGDGTIPQSERAFTVRPRSTPLNNANRYTADRGPNSSIQLIASQTKDEVLALSTLSGNAASNRAVGSVLEDLMSDSGYSGFLLTNVDVSMNEKVQVNEVFGDSEVVYYFGRSPLQFNLSGLVFDDVDNGWFYKFITSYWALLRGTQMAKNYQLARINLPNMTITGSIMGISYSQDSSRDTDIRFNMQFLAKTIVPRPVLLPSELLSADALKINISQAELPERFQNMAVINKVKSSISEAKAYLGSTLGGVSGWMSDVGNAITDAGEYIGGIGDTIQGVIGEARSLFEGASGLLPIAELRANLLSPVYGVVTTLTKVVKSITGDVLSIISGPGNILSEVFKDVRSIANEALSLVNAIEGGIDSIVGTFENSANDLRRTISALKNTAGAISRSPENISNILKRATKSGLKSGHMASLRSGRVSRSKKALLSSGTPYTASSGASLGG